MDKQIYISKQAMEMVGIRYFKKKTEHLYQKYATKVENGEYIPLEKGLFIHQSPISTDLDIVVGKNDNNHKRLTDIKKLPSKFTIFIQKIKNILGGIYENRS